MPTPEILRQGRISKPKLPVNYDSADAAIFSPALEVVIPPTVNLQLKNISISPDSILSRGSRVLPESFPAANFLDGWAGRKYRCKFFLANLKRHKSIDGQAIWFSDIWSQGYFHWMTDALPRLLSIRDRIADAILLLPGSFRDIAYIRESLKPFQFRELQFVDETVVCKNLVIPTRTAPTGNYNEGVIRELRAFYTQFYGANYELGAGERIFVSRSKAQFRKITNEAECIEVAREYGFKTVYFEDYSFEQQVKIALNARYFISNHGAGLTNMLFMRAGGKVLEIRKRGDALNNCYFALASAAQLNYFYQLGDAQNPAEDAHTANLQVDCGLLRQNIERMLAH